MAIQGTSFRIVPSTLDFYKGGGRGEENSPKARSHCSPIPRRLVSEIQIQKVTCDSSTVANASVQSPRFASKPEQIGPHPDKGFRVRRVQVQNRNSQSISDERRIVDIQVKGAQFLQTNPNPAQDWISILGLLTSTEKMVPLGRLHLRELQYCLKSQWSQARENAQKLVPLTVTALYSLKWWMDETNLRKGSPTHPPKPHYHVFTDASTQGWGAHMDMEVVSGKWSPEQRQLHINNLKLRAVRLALLHWEKILLDSVVLVATDNSTVVAYINKQGGGGQYPDPSA